MLDARSECVEAQETYQCGNIRKGSLGNVCHVVQASVACPRSGPISIDRAWGHENVFECLLVGMRDAELEARRAVVP